MLTLKHQLDWKTVPSQDGAIYGGKLFRFNADGKCRVYDVNDGTLLSEFTLSSVDVICPHANAVCFGAEKYDENDEYPLLYSNMYNNAAAKEDRLEGVCCVYRLTCTDGEYNAALVQLIRIGFAAGGEEYVITLSGKSLGNGIAGAVGGAGNKNTTIHKFLL